MKLYNKIKFNTQNNLETKKRKTCLINNINNYLKISMKLNKDIKIKIRNKLKIKIKQLFNL